MCVCGTGVQYSNFVSPDRYQYRLQLSTDSKFCMQLSTPISLPTTRKPFIGRLYFIYQSIGQIISFQMMPPLRSFDDLDEKERGHKKTDDLRAMTTLGPRTLQLMGAATRGHQYKYRIPYCRTNTYKDCFFPSSIRLLNQLSENLTNAESRQGFQQPHSPRLQDVFSCF